MNSMKLLSSVSGFLSAIRKASLPEHTQSGPTGSTQPTAGGMHLFPHARPTPLVEYLRLDNALMHNDMDLAHSIVAKSDTLCRSFIYRDGASMRSLVENKIKLLEGQRTAHFHHVPEQDVSRQLETLRNMLVFF